MIDSSIAPGELSYGELVIPGDRTDEVIISAHVCHPSLANDNLTGIVVATELAKTLLAARPPALHLPLRVRAGHDRLDRLAQPASRRLAADPARAGADRAGWRWAAGLQADPARHHGRSTGPPAMWSGARTARSRAYSPYGYDERQFNSVGFDLPVGRLSRTPHGEYPEYHTSADNLDFVRAEELAESYAAVTRDRPDPGTGPALSQPQPVRRTPARQARAVPDDRRPGGERCRDGDAVDPRLLRRGAHAAGHRRGLRPRLRRHRRGRRRSWRAPSCWSPTGDPARS